MNSFVKSLNRRWSLHIVKGNELAYAMHANSVTQLLGYIIEYYASNRRPIEPWNLYLSTNGQSLRLKREHFTANGDSPAPCLLEQINSLDSRWRYFKTGDVWFEEVATQKELKITDAPPLGRNIATIQNDLEAMLRNPSANRETTFFSVMEEVFRGKANES